MEKQVSVRGDQLQTLGWSHKVRHHPPSSTFLAFANIKQRRVIHDIAMLHTPPILRIIQRTQINNNSNMKFASPTLILVYTAATAQAFSSTGVRSTARTVATTTQLSAEKKRVVVTGLGVISGCGIGHNDFFQNVADGKSSLGKVTRFDVTHYPCQIGSEVPANMFNPTDHFANPKNAKSNDRFTHFAVAASRLALKDAGLGDTPETLENPEKCGVFVGSAFGGMETFENEVLKLWKKPDRPKVSCS